MQKLFSTMTCSGFLAVLMAMIPIAYSAPAAAEAGKRLCGWDYPSRGYMVVGKVNKGDSRACNDVIYQLGRFNSPDAVKMNGWTCEDASSRLGAGHVDICGGGPQQVRYGWNGVLYYQLTRRAYPYQYQGALATIRGFPQAPF